MGTNFINFTTDGREALVNVWAVNKIMHQTFRGCRRLCSNCDHEFCRLAVKMTPRRRGNSRLVRYPNPKKLEPILYKETESPEQEGGDEHDVWPEILVGNICPALNQIATKGNVRKPFNGRIAINGYIREPLSDSEEEDMSDSNGFPSIMYIDPNLHELYILSIDHYHGVCDAVILFFSPFVEPGLLPEKTIWSLEVSGPESLPWFESGANIKEFTHDFPDIRQVCVIAYGTFVFRTNLKPSEGDSPRMLVKRLRSSLRTFRITMMKDYCTEQIVQQILWTRPHDPAL